MAEIIIRNSAKCLKCNTEVESVHRHDFKGCKCGNIYVDGGKEYIRRCGNLYAEPPTWIDTSITKEKSKSRELVPVE